MQSVLTVFGTKETEIILEKSRFVTYSTHVESENEARAFLSEIKKAHPFATHVVYAFIADKTGNVVRFSDDGEPQGTAGLPVLEVLKNKGLFETAVAVVRYFGGIKLGAGGLTRAYASSASENLKQANVRRLEEAVELKLIVAYDKADFAEKYIFKQNAVLIKKAYEQEVEFIVAVKKKDEEAFEKGVVDYLLGKVKWTPLREYFFPFEA